MSKGIWSRTKRHRKRKHRHKENPMKEIGKNKHHCYPSRDVRHNREIKVVDSEAHRRYHHLVGDMIPEQAVRYIAKNFMPTDIEKVLLEVIR